MGAEHAAPMPAAHAAWSRIGAPGKARAVAAAMRAAGLPAPVAQHRRTRVPAAAQAAPAERGGALPRRVHEGPTKQPVAPALNSMLTPLEAYLTAAYRPP